MTHLVPENDSRSHHHSKKCWCKPIKDGKLLIHNANDSRDIFERAIGQAMIGKPWIVIINGVPIENNPWIRGPLDDAFRWN